MKRLVQWSIEHHRLVLALSVLLAAAGLWTARDMPVDVFPDLTAPTVTILTEGHGIYVTDVDGRDHVLLLASLSTPSRSRPIALARYVRVPSTRAAVASVVVERSMRRRGIAARLFADLVAIASARGIERFRVDARVCDPAGLRLVRAVAIRRAVVWAGAAPTLELPLADMG